MTDRPHPAVVEPFTSARQQLLAGKMGIYIFLGPEIMLFGGLFLAILTVRLENPTEAIAASKALHLWIGAANTTILLTSSLLVACMVEAARQARLKAAALLATCAALLGVAFLGVKFMEYGLEASEGLLPIASLRPHFSGPVQHLFMNLYLVATALHALHLTIGIGLMGWTAARLATGRFRVTAQSTPAELPSLYWHFVDIVWVFLYPLLYLLR